MDPVLMPVIVVGGLILWIGTIILYFVYRDRICYNKSDSSANNLDGILPNSGKRNNTYAYAGKRRVSLSKLAEIERAKKFRERAKLSSLGRPQFKLTTKHSNNNVVYSFFNITSIMSNATPRERLESDTVSSSSQSGRLLSDSKILAIDGEPEDVERGERKSEDGEIAEEKSELFLETDV
mmetsp:Transcript_24347/g.33427  ORF Transcript_24347/g.33427 Transcript_24347/m.33427 type:complete len:180 (+) Transcript_24347:30-569(+)